MKTFSNILLIMAALVVLSGCSVDGSVLSKVGEDNPTFQKGYREGYLAGQADTAQREYWVSQDRHRWRETVPSSGKTTYYTIPTEKRTTDGRVLEGANITVPIVEPR